MLCRSCTALKRLRAVYSSGQAGQGSCLFASQEREDPPANLAVVLRHVQPAKPADGDGGRREAQVLLLQALAVAAGEPSERRPLVVDACTRKQ